MRRRRELIVGALAALSAACSTDTFTPVDASTEGGGDAASDAMLDASADAVTSDASPDASPLPVQPIACGTTTCTSGQTCCVYTKAATDGGLTISTSCQAQCPAPTGSQHLAELACTGAADCGSNVCCIHRQNNVDISACEPSCASSNNEVQLCDPQAVDAGCPSSQPCSTNNIADWNLPATFATCGGQSVP